MPYYPPPSAGSTAASQADQETSTSTSNFVSPGRQQYHPSACKGWVNFSPAAAIQASYNVISLTDNGVGNFNVNWDVDLSSANYCVNSAIELSALTAITPLIGTVSAGSSTQSLSVDTAGALTETNVAGYHISVYGDQ